MIDVIQTKSKENQLSKMKSKKRREEKSVARVVCCKNSYRLELAPEVVEVLSLEASVKIGFSSNAIVLTKQGKYVENEFTLRGTGKTKYVYCKSLIQEIIETLEISMDGHTSCSMYGCHLEVAEEEEYLLIYVEVGMYEEPLSERELLIDLGILCPEEGDDENE